MTPKYRGEKLRTFRKGCDVYRLETRPSPKKKRVFEMERARCEGDATVPSTVGLETFSTLNIHHYLIHVKNGIFRASFAIFKPLNAFLYL